MILTFDDSLGRATVAVPKKDWAIVSFNELNPMGTLEFVFNSEESAKNYLRALNDKAREMDAWDHAAHTKFVMYKRVEVEQEVSEEGSGSETTEVGSGSSDDNPDRGGSDPIPY